MKPNPQNMTNDEAHIYLVTEVSNIKEDVGELKDDFKDYVKEQPGRCDDKYATEGKVYGVLLKCLIGIAALGGLIITGIKLIPAAIASIL